KRPNKEGSPGPPAVLRALGMPLKQAVWTHLACSDPLSGCFPPPLVPHTITGCADGGTRHSSTARSVHTWSVRPAVIAGAHGRHRWAAPRPFVTSGASNGW